MGYKDGNSSIHDDKCSCFIKNEKFLSIGHSPSLPILSIFSLLMYKVANFKCTSFQFHFILNTVLEYVHVMPSEV
jgi:hypothetical protein